MKLLHHAYAFFLTATLLVSFNDSPYTSPPNQRTPFAERKQVTAPNYLLMEGQNLVDIQMVKMPMNDEEIFFEAPSIIRKSGMNYKTTPRLWLFPGAALPDNTINSEVASVTMMAGHSYIGGHGGN